MRESPLAPLGQSRLWWAGGEAKCYTSPTTRNRDDWGLSIKAYCLLLPCRASLWQSRGLISARRSINQGTGHWLRSLDFGETMDTQPQNSLKEDEAELIKELVALEKVRCCRGRQGSVGPLQPALSHANPCMTGEGGREIADSRC